jgi:hypothetical protein
MTPIKQAVANAMEFADGVLGAGRTLDLRLEEIESSEIDGAPIWLITLSFQRTSYARDYKTFSIRKDTGEVLAMKIRELAGNNA